MAVAEDRLAKFGFEKIIDGSVVSFQLRVSSITFFADPDEKARFRSTVIDWRPQNEKGGSRN
jgi:hypothetical protein